MTRRKRGVLTLLTSGAIALAAPAVTGSPSVTDRALPKAQVDTKVADLRGQMTPEEKAGKLSQYFYFTQFLPLEEQVDKEIAVGRAGSVLFTTDPKLVNRARKTAIEQSSLGIPLLFSFDVIHGFHTIFPAPLAMAASWAPAMAEKAQAVAASKARAVGMHWTFAPMADSVLHARRGRVFESAGEDLYLGSAMAAAQVRASRVPHRSARGPVVLERITKA